MSFVELGASPFAPSQSTRDLLITQSTVLMQQIVTNLTQAGLS